MTDLSLMIVSGMAFSPFGAGRCLTHIRRFARDEPNLGISIRALLPERFSLINILVRAWILRPEERPTLIFHPQSLGYARVIGVLERRPFTWIQALDNSFFCRKSHNHRDDESAPCLECLEGNFHRADHHRCRFFPKGQSPRVRFEARLRTLARDRRVGFFAQSSTQAALLRRHFGTDAIIETIGMWADFDDGEKRDDVPPPSLPRDFDPKRTILFHGEPLPAKGIGWTLRLMEHRPDDHFLFPFSLERLKNYGLAVPRSCAQRCRFVPVRWESGLKWLTRRCFLTLSPALWSATIDGALIKSLMIGNRVGVVENPSAYCREIPNDILWKLSPRPEKAAGQIGTLPRHDSRARAAWLRQFRKNNRSFPRRMAQIAARYARCESP